MTSWFALLAHWSVGQKPNRVSSVQLRSSVCALAGVRSRHVSLRQSLSISSDRSDYRYTQH